MNSAALTSDVVPNVDFVEIDSSNKVIFSLGGSDRLSINTIKVREKAKELRLTESNLGNCERDRYLSVINSYFNSLSTEELKKRSDKILALSAAEPTEQPERPYPLWEDRPVKRGTNPAHWIQQYHGDLIGTEGARAAIGRRDPGLIQTYASWIRPGRHPEDDLGLDTQLATLHHLSAEEILDRKRKQLQEAALRHRQKSYRLAI